MHWNYFARDTVGKQLVRAADSIVQLSLRELVGEDSWTIGGLYAWLEGH